jgi:integrase/recombinase XerD
MKSKNLLTRLLEGFFTERLLQQKRVSPQTVAAYRDTFRLLFNFLHVREHKLPSDIAINDIDARHICDFLNYLETTRGNSVRSRNHRLAGIRSFFKYVSLCEPALAAHVQRILAIPQKKYEKKIVTHLNPEEVTALLKAPDQQKWTGRRDYAWLLLALKSGLRVSELIGLHCNDIFLDHTGYLQCQGKGRKERRIPLGKDIRPVLQAWLRERNGNPSDPLFPNSRGNPMSRDGFEYLLLRYAEIAQTICPSLADKRVTPHVLRHTTAVTLLQAGIDRAVIALWLGHESLQTTQVYLDADLENTMLETNCWLSSNLYETSADYAE